MHQKKKKEITRTTQINVQVWAPKIVRANRVGDLSMVSEGSTTIR